MAKSQGVLLFVALGSLSGHALAFNFELGSANFRLDNQLTLGAAWRVEERDERLLGKLNVPGQETLCAADDCMSQSGDPAPNQRLVDADGGYNGNGDDGNMNYDKGDITHATIQYQPEMTLLWGDLAGKISGIAYYDPKNADFRTYNENTIYQPERAPRHHDLEQDMGEDLRLLEAFVSYAIPVGSNNLNISVGQQRLRWGESTFLIFSSLNQINPPSARLLALPGIELKNVFLPVGMVVADYNLTANLNINAFYQYDWEPVEPDPAGSFLSTTDVGGGGDGPTNITLGLGQFPEDPDRKFVKAGLSSTITSSTRTAYLEDESFGYPEDGGQYGLRLNYYAEWLNGGTDLSLYGMNYHSRLPYLSAHAANRSCLRDVNNIDASGLSALLPDLLDAINLGGLLDPAVDQTKFAQALVACGGFNGSANIVDETALTDLLGQVPGAPEIGQEPLPVDTVRPFLDYPEDIHLFGVSGTTNMGKWSLAGELSFSPNQPVQVATRDVIFAAEQPAFPEEDIGIPSDAAAALTIPGARHIVPDFVRTRYRNDPVEAGELVRGYERLKVGQISFTGIRAFSSSNWLHADQILLLVEVGATGIFNLPELSDLQIEGAGADNTHYSPGADGSGSGGVPDPLRLNPEQADPDIFADDFAWGYRLLFQPTYNNLVFGKTVVPRLVFFHDVKGTSAFPIQNFVEDRKRLIGGLETRLTRNLVGVINYVVFFGAGNRNLRGDRDFISAYVTYAF